MTLAEIDTRVGALRTSKTPQDIENEIRQRADQIDQLGALKQRGMPNDIIVAILQGHLMMILVAGVEFGVSPSTLITKALVAAEERSASIRKANLPDNE